MYIFILIYFPPFKLHKHNNEVYYFIFYYYNFISTNELNDLFKLIPYPNIRIYNYNIIMIDIIQVN